ncbi:hypothetical protein [Paenibacillus sp. UNC451MF]|uniref:hypothetical protein n=1 Tax=Paenibacillus sp. UNC451MF TaxID=1449063 RepID=UPI00068929BD|nr:hypothetical protein [Paenibacillus sp. UNC451MF]
MSDPRTYADWVRCFDELKSGDNDEEMLNRMEQGSIEWTAGIAEKMTQRLYEVLEFRLKHASQQMNLEFSRVREPNIDVVRALMNARKRFAIMKRLVVIPAFPEQVRSTLTDVLSNYVKDTQAALEDSAKDDRSGHLRMLIKNNSLLGYNQIELSMEDRAPAANPGMQGANQKRRKVIF